MRNERLQPVDTHEVRSRAPGPQLFREFHARGDFHAHRIHPVKEKKGKLEKKKTWTPTEQEYYIVSKQNKRTNCSVKSTNTHTHTHTHTHTYTHITQPSPHQMQTQHLRLLVNRLRLEKLGRHLGHLQWTTAKRHCALCAFQHVCNRW